MWTVPFAVGQMPSAALNNSFFITLSFALPAMDLAMGHPRASRQLPRPLRQRVPIPSVPDPYPA